MSDKEPSTIQVICPCCSATLTVDPLLSVVLGHRLPDKPPSVTQLKDASRVLEEEATRREERYRQILEAEKNKGKVLERKFQELLKKAKEEPIQKPLKDIDLD